MTVSLSIPTLQPGIDPIPTACPACRSSLLSVSHADGGEQFGSLSCGACSREIAWLHPPVRERAFPEAETLVVPEPEPDDPWRRVSCNSDCRRERVIVVSGLGSTRAQWREYHSITAHDDHTTVLLLALGSVLHQQIVAAVTPKPFPIEPGPAIVRSGPLVVDRPARRVYVHGVEAHLTDGEYALLDVLCERFGAIVVRELVLAAVWPDRQMRNGKGKLKGDAYRAVRTLVNRLRDKLGPAGDLIDTFVARGFLLRDEPPTSGEWRVESGASSDELGVASGEKDPLTTRHSPLATSSPLATLHS